jgi:hypothetical protein
MAMQMTQEMAMMNAVNGTGNGAANGDDECSTRPWKWR